MRRGWPSPTAAETRANQETTGIRPWIFLQIFYDGDYFVSSRYNNAAQCQRIRIPRHTVADLCVRWTIESHTQVPSCTYHLVVSLTLQLPTDAHPPAPFLKPLLPFPISRQRIPTGACY